MPNKKPCDCCKCPITKLVYIAGPTFNIAERNEQLRIAQFLESRKFPVFLPQRDGLQFDRVYDRLIRQGLLEEAALKETKRIIYHNNIFNLLKADVLVAYVSGIEPDSGTISLSAIAFSACMPLVMYKDGSRYQTALAELDPMVSELPNMPAATRLFDVPTQINKLLAKRQCKCISSNLKDILKDASKINFGQFR